ncbi:hypothetical protein BCF74_11730 [Knoellia remsis]|uniref:Uncharacterized protein n=1 Tax=Knoellia remsis TaxID=407159 RepID=A0A2T0UGE9_9MICO|nr:hypothetical protein [Knoellia remsis]PRY57025.1 hypothetical protein BCF74_11730 [Knoellia remsis]
MIPRTQTFHTAVRIADRIRSFARPGTSGWNNIPDMDRARTGHELMVALQWEQHRPR